MIERQNHVPQHVRHDEESHMASPNVDLVEMRDAAVASGDGDVLELDVHVVFGCWEKRSVEIRQVGLGRVESAL